MYIWSDITQQSTATSHVASVFLTQLSVQDTTRRETNSEIKAIKDHPKSILSQNKMHQILRGNLLDMNEMFLSERENFTFVPDGETNCFELRTIAMANQDFFTLGII